VDETFHVDAPADVVRAHFANLDAIAAATEEAEHTEQLGDGRLRMELVEQRQGIHKVKPVYTVRYGIEGDDVVWSTLDGNMVSEGRATVTARADGTSDVHYHHRIELELGVGKLVARALQPVVDRLVAASIRRYLKHLQDHVPRG
jgi:hypothetical protein